MKNCLPLIYNMLWKKWILLQKVLNDGTSHLSRKLVGNKYNFTGITNTKACSQIGREYKQYSFNGCRTRKSRRITYSKCRKDLVIPGVAQRKDAHFYENLVNACWKSMGLWQGKGNQMVQTFDLLLNTLWRTVQSQEQHQGKTSWAYSNCLFLPNLPYICESIPKWWPVDDR